MCAYERVFVHILCLGECVRARARMCVCAYMSVSVNVLI